MTMFYFYFFSFSSIPLLLLFLLLLLSDFFLLSRSFHHCVFIPVCEFLFYFISLCVKILASFSLLCDLSFVCHTILFIHKLRVLWLRHIIIKIIFIQLSLMTSSIFHILSGCRSGLFYGDWLCGGWFLAWWFFLGWIVPNLNFSEDNWFKNAQLSVKHPWF